MNYDPSRPPLTLHVPSALLGLAFAIFLAAQIASVDRGGKTMRWQLSNLDQQKTSLQEAQKRLVESTRTREVLAKQSSQVEQQYTSLFNEVLELAADDEDAKTVVQKWGIQKQTTPAANTTNSGTKPDEKKAP